jgi:hypothetical protein
VGIICLRLGQGFRESGNRLCSPSDLTELRLCWWTVYLTITVEESSLLSSLIALHTYPSLD